jgi:predicted ATPase/class 3 adenylate cyclase
MFPKAELPTGIVTFLFTDIEKSTLLWEQNPDQMWKAMEQHDALIEAAVAANSGMIVRPRGEGDSRFAVFILASDAIHAAVEIQRQFFHETWALDFPVRVRIGIHTGEADVRQGDYYGLAVNRAARIRAAAHGGQTLVSMSTASLVQDVLPPGTLLKALGEYHLHDLQRPERIFQLVIPELPADFPPINGSVKDPISNLPLHINSFIGREREISEIKNLLGRNRLVTILGMGGLGKTRLALQVGFELINYYHDGVWIVDLAPLEKPELVVKAVADVFKIREDESRPLLETLVDVLRIKKLLLIMDNCEHLIREVSQLCGLLIKCLPQLHILTTSREPLGLAGETLWPIPPLALPKNGQAVELEETLQYDAVKLFVERAVAVRPQFTLSEKTAPAVLRISKKLEGNPLAIELAAARTKVLSVEDIADRLERDLKLLFARGKAVPSRQQTLEALIDWSYRLLDPDEKTLLDRLGIFKGGWMLPAAEAVCSSEEIDSWMILDLLDSLIDKTLVVSEIHGKHQRYRFLEMIREYALRRLEQRGEKEAVAEKHAAYFLQIAEESYGELWGPDQGNWLDCLQTEHDNLRAALEWAKETPERAGTLLRLAGCLWRFWVIRGYSHEGYTWLKLALDRNRAAPAEMRANGLRGAGYLAFQQGDYTQAEAFHQESLALYREIEDKLGIARQMDVLGEIQWMKGSPEEAVKLHTESLALHYEVDNKEGVALALEHLGVLARDQGEYENARMYLMISLDNYRELGNELFTASALNNLGLVAYLLCEYKQAYELFEEALEFYRQLDDRFGKSEVELHLGNVAKDQADFQRAEHLYQECLDLKNNLGDKLGAARVASGLAEIAFYRGNYSSAINVAEQSYLHFKEHGVKRGMVISIMIMAVSMIYQGNLDRGEELAREGLALSSAIETPRSLAYTKTISGLAEHHRGNLEAAEAYHQEALAIFRRIDDGRSIAHALVNLARTAYRQENSSAAAAYLDESITISRKLDTRWSLAYSLEIMGILKLSEGDLKAALALLKESLQLSIEQANRQGILNCLGAIAGVATKNQDTAKAAYLFAAADSLRKAMGVKMAVGDQQEYESYQARLKEALGEDKYHSLMMEGDSAGISEAVEQAMRVELVLA